MGREITDPRGREIAEKVQKIFKSKILPPQEEIDMVWEEAKEYMRTLPTSAERGAFYWRSLLEGFFLLTTESRGDKEEQ